MSGYREMALGQVLAPASEQVSVEPDVTYATVGVYSFGRGLFARPAITGAQTRYRTLNQLHVDQLVVSRLNGWEGAVAVVGNEWGGSYVSQEFPTFDIDRTLATPAYLAWMSRWPRLWDLLGGGTRGSMVRRKRVHPDEVLRVEIPLPELPEQRRIVARLDALFTRVEEVEHLAAKIAKLPVLLYPAQVDAAFAAVAREQRAVGELVDLVSDIVHPGDDYGNARSFIGLQHIESHTGRKLGESPIGGEQGRKFRFAPGDLLYGYLRPYLNKVWLADSYGLCSVDQYVLRPKPGVTGELVAHALRGRGFLATAIDLTHSLQLPRLRSGLLMDVRVAWPARKAEADLLRDLDRARARVLKLLAAQGARRARVEALGPAILTHAFSGEL